LASISASQTRRLAEISFFIGYFSNGNCRWASALQEAYESGKLRGSQLIQTRRVIERRRSQSRAIGGKMASCKPNADVTTSSLVHNYQREVERQKQLVRKAETAESIDSLPQYWRIGSGRGRVAHEQASTELCARATIS